MVLVLVWVDDLLSFATAKAENDVLAQELAARYEIKELGSPSMLLGIQVCHNRDERTVTLSQAHYIDAIVSRVGLSEAKPVATPLDPNVSLK